MKVCLVVPKTSISFASDCSPPLGLAYIASYLKEHCPSVQIKIVDSVSGADPLRDILEFQPNIVGITATTPQINAVYALAEDLKRNRPDILTILGGSHASCLPQEAIQHVDFVVVGEGEVAFSKIVKNIVEHRPMPRIVQGEPIDTLDELPSPAYDLLNMKFYLQRTWLADVLPPPVLGMVTSRGCPYKCAFCYNSWRTAKVRYFSAERVATELLMLHKQYGVNHFFFQDDEFLINRKRLNELALLFKKHGIDKWIRWGCQARVTSLNKSLLDQVENMGCVLIAAGIESYAPRILRYLKQNSVKIEDQDRAINLFKHSKVVLHGNFVFGTPTETLDEMKASHKFYLHNPEIRTMSANILTPYPGTKVWQDCKKRNLLPEKIDYAELIPTPEGKFNVSTLPPKVFSRFLLQMNRMNNIVRAVRVKPSLRTFLKRCNGLSWWQMWLIYPKEMASLMHYSIAAKRKENS